VIFTPGTARRLLPFTLTLLKGAGVRLRLVANGCDAEEARLLSETAASGERLSHHVLTNRDTVAHGVALNELFGAYPDEPYFAFADSDVIASGEFMDALWPAGADHAGVFTAPPVWATEDDVVVPAGWPVLSGRLHQLPDGTQVGTTYLAVYDRAAVESAWRRVPRGFELQFRRSVPRSLRREFAARGWDFRIYDTCRVVNLQLLLEGRRLENRPVPALHHIGGVSGAGFAGPVALLRSLPLLMRSKEHRRPARLAEYVMFRYFLWSRRTDAHHRAPIERRSVVSSHVAAVLEAVEAREPVPPTPATGSAEVDRRLAALMSAIEAEYRPLSP
jgi:hypothetical protein